MDLSSRRERLRTLPTPDAQLDYVTSLRGRIDWQGAAASIRVTVRYVPDRDVLDPDSFADYLNGVGKLDWPSLEAAGAAILDDINNQAVPRFILVSLASAKDEGEGILHSVLLEDQQPGWSNPSLLALLERH